MVTGMPKMTLRACISALALAYALAWFLPRVTAKGLFSDGLVYTVIAHNLSQGIGSAWAPVIRNHHFLYHPEPVFYDHPPLVFWIESMVYRLAGDHTEWVYNSLVMLLVVLATGGLFRRMHPAQRLGPLAWSLPVLFLFLAPEWAKKSAYNLLDMTMAVFTTASVYAILRGLAGQRHHIAWYLAGGAGIVAAFLAKGPVGLFPLAVPFLYAIVFPGRLRVREALRVLGWTSLLPLAATAAILAYMPAREFMSHYLKQQVMDSLSGQREAATSLVNHLGILVKIAEQVIVILVVILVLRWRLVRPGTTKIAGFTRPAWLFLLIGLSASLPMVVSAKHHSFYLFPALIFFALSAASLVVAWIPVAVREQRRQGYSVGVLLAGLAIAAVFFCFLRGERYYRTHAGFLSVMDDLVAKVPDGSTVTTSPDILRNRDDVNGYLERYHDIILTTDPGASGFYLALRNDPVPDRKTETEIVRGDFRLVSWSGPPGQ